MRHIYICCHNDCIMHNAMRQERIDVFVKDKKCIPLMSIMKARYGDKLMSFTRPSKCQQHYSIYTIDINN